MLTDGFGLALSTASSAARDAYVEGCGLLLTIYPGAVVAFDRAIEADPGFSLAYLAKARALQTAGDLPGAKASLAQAKALPTATRAREASQAEIFHLIFAGLADAALDGVRAHLAEWPRDAIVVSTSASQTGLIALSGRARRQWELVEFLDGLAPHFDGEDEWWFDAHHGMALSETGQQTAARPKLERSLAQNRRNASVAHGFAHFCYEIGDHAGGIAFLCDWLADYPRQGTLHGHLNWHLAICQLETGDFSEALRIYADAIAAEDYAGPALFKLFDATSFLWRSELAGHLRDAAQWRVMQDFAHKAMPRPGLPYADWHVALADAATADDAAVAERLSEMETMIRDGRYVAGSMVADLTRAFVAFERSDFDAVIGLLAPLLAERERIGGSQAQLDLVDFTLMKAYAGAGRPAELADLLGQRRPGPARVPVTGLEAAIG